MAEKMQAYKRTYVKEEHYEASVDVHPWKSAVAMSIEAWQTRLQALIDAGAPPTAIVSVAHDTVIYVGWEAARDD